MPWEKQFDKADALGRALDAFWWEGYDATSMTDLLDRMGIQKGSFYATFGSKHEILVEALERYTAERSEEFERLHSEPSPRGALERHLRTLAGSACSADGQRGCFAVNAGLELAGRDAKVREIVQRAMRGHEQHYFRLLVAARARGEVARELDPRETARGLLALVLGIRVLSRSRAPCSVIESVRDQALALLGP